MRIKLLIVSLLFVIFYLLLLPVTVHAQNSTQSATPPAQATGSSYLNTNPDVPTNLHTYTQSIFIELASAISCLLTGSDPINPGMLCLGIDPTTHKIGYVEGGGG